MRSYDWHERAYRAHAAEPTGGTSEIAEASIDEVKRRFMNFLQSPSGTFDEESRSPRWVYYMLGLTVPPTASSSVTTVTTSFLRKRYLKLALHMHPDKDAGWVHANEAFHLLKLSLIHI